MKKNFESFMRIINQLNFVLDRQQKIGAVQLFLNMLMSSVLDLLGVASIYPFLQLILNQGGLRSQKYIAWIFVYYPKLSDVDIILIAGIAVIVVYLFKNISLIFFSYKQIAFSAQFQRESSIKMLSSYLKRPYQYFLNTNSSIILRGINSDVAGVYQILLNLFTMISELFTILAIGIFLLTIDWVIALSAILLAGICFFIIVSLFKGRIKNAGREAQLAYALKAQYGNQAINGIKEITVLDRKEKFIENFNKAAMLEQKSVIMNSFLNACPNRILEGVCISGFMGIICVKIACGTNLETFIPVLGIFAMGAFRILPSIAKISSRINALIYYQPFLQNVYDNLKEVKEYESYLEEIGISRENKDKNIQFQENLVVRNISWKYQNAKEDVLESASLYIRKGESIAFIGSSGAGKTTMADIIMGLLRPQSGAVEMDGIDIFTIPHQWSKIIGYVPQAVFLIDDSVRSNVAFGLDKNEVSDEKVWDALEKAQLREFVEGLPYGLDTVVGERGVKFSGGQRQRIAIARALYENPDILVLDEATSALDNETETAVMESIDALQGAKTLIIVAHRLTTIRNCDRIYEVGNGKAIERKKEDIFPE